MSILPRSLQLGLLSDIWATLLRGKYWIIIFGAIGLVGSLLVAQYTPKHYRVEAVLAPQSQSQSAGIAGLMSQIGGLPALANLALGQDSSSANSLATLRGPQFTAGFIRKLGLEPQMYPHRWDPTEKRWTGPEPTDLELVRAFDEGGIRTIVEDRRTGLLTIRIEWRDPAQAAAILNSLIDAVNDDLRSKALQESTRSVAYLTSELDKTTAVDLRQTINALIATNMKQSVLASVRRDYAFRIVSAVVVPTARDYVWPRRVLIVVTGLVFGLIAGLLVSFIGGFHSPKQTQHLRQ